MAEYEKKWQKYWKENKIFETDVDEKKEKYFITQPYPYCNGLPHVGHMYSYSRGDTFAKFQRLMGKNVLYPFAFHVTGSPIVAAAKRIEKGDSAQIKILIDNEIDEKDVAEYANPKKWIETFPDKWKRDLNSYGMSIDWRRSFFTTDLNPYYDKFIQWQFNRLHEMGFVKKGKFPVVWDPVTNQVVPDHSRKSGEGETPQEFTVLKYKWNDKYVVCATLRPETVYGQTNLWIDPNYEYEVAKVNEETWVLSQAAVNKLSQQDKKVELIGKIMGSELVGEEVEPILTKNKIPILPAQMVDANIGTGIVFSVPAHAPHDYMALVDLQNNESELTKYNLDADKINAIKPIPLIKLEGYGEIPAKEICEKLNIKSQKAGKLEQAKKELYKQEFHNGVMLDNTEEYKGLKVEIAKDKAKAKLLKSGDADKLYELTGEVISRNLNKCIVKIVEDQWFLDYGSEEWKKTAHECLDGMKLYPEKSRDQFNYVIDWLHEWACTHKAEGELGTKLPWDPKWVIESLSDSTLYNAYYTVSHVIEQIPFDQLDETFFDEVFLNKGKCKVKNREVVEALKKEFNYFYPVDLRSSGKDLIQNHLTFMIFNHTAIFGKENWPQGYSVNGWVTVDKQKMSKSLGNFITVRQMLDEYGADVSRITILNGGEGLDDCNFDRKFAQTFGPKLINHIEQFRANYNQGNEDHDNLDEWMISKLHKVIGEVKDSMGKMNFRTAFQKLFFELNIYFKYYQNKKTAGIGVNKHTMNEVLMSQLIMMVPFAPHACEELFDFVKAQNGEYTGSILNASFPDSVESKINEEIENSIDFLENLSGDIDTVLRLAKIDKPNEIKVIISAAWKYDFYKKLKELLQTKTFKEVFDEFKSDSHFEKIKKLLPQIMKTGKWPSFVTSQDYEIELLNKINSQLKSKYNCEIKIEKAEESEEKKADAAQPSKAAIVIK